MRGPMRVAAWGHVTSTGAIFPGGAGVATTAGNPENRALNAPHEQCNSADSDHQHHERYGIVIEPVPNLCTHDDPHPVQTAFFWVRALSAASPEQAGLPAQKGAFCWRRAGRAQVLRVRAGLAGL